MLLGGSDEWITKYKPELKKFIQEANLNSISVHAMTLEWAGFCFDKEHSKAMKLIEEILLYNYLNPDKKFDGIHIDVEPYTYKEHEKDCEDDGLLWGKNDDDNETIMKQYVGLLQIIRNYIDFHDSSIKFTAAIGAGYEDDYQKGILPSGSAVILGTYLDDMYPMVYDDIGDSADSIKICAKKEIIALEDASSDCGVVIGVSPKEFDDYETFEDTIDDVNDYFEDKQSYRGISIFKYSFFRDAFEPLDYDKQILGLIIRWATYVVTRYGALSTICNPNVILQSIKRLVQSGRSYDQPQYFYKVSVQAGGGYHTHTEMKLSMNVIPKKVYAKGSSDDSLEERAQIGINPNYTFYGKELLSINGAGWINASTKLDENNRIKYLDGNEIFMILDSKWGSDKDTYIHFWFSSDIPLTHVGYSLLDNWSDDFGYIKIDSYEIID